MNEKELKELIKKLNPRLLEFVISEANRELEDRGVTPPDRRLPGLEDEYPL